MFPGKSLRCALGLHAFVPWAVNSVVEPLAIEKCRRCGCGRKFLICGASIRYSVEQMREAAEDLARRAKEEWRDDAATRPEA